MFQTDLCSFALVVSWHWLQALSLVIVDLFSRSLAAEASTLIHVLRVVVWRHVVVHAWDSATELVLSGRTLTLVLTMCAVLGETACCDDIGWMLGDLAAELIENVYAFRLLGHGQIGSQLP